MRVETFPLIIGILVALLGIGIIFDAWTPDASTVSMERRRRPRIERHRNGEALIGFGVLALAAAFIGRDSWNYSVLVVIIGAVLNWHYVRELFVNRGPLRRRDPGAIDAPPPVERPAGLQTVSDVAETGEPDERWSGVERRKTPREGNRPRSARRGAPGQGEDRSRG